MHLFIVDRRLLLRSLVHSQCLCSLCLHITLIYTEYWTIFDPLSRHQHLKGDLFLKGTLFYFEFELNLFVKPVEIMTLFIPLEH